PAFRRFHTIDIMELQAGLFEVVSQICDVKTMRPWLAQAAEGGIGVGQQETGDGYRLSTIEVDIGEAVAVRPELHADIDGGVVEVACGCLRGDDAPLPFLADRLLGLA